MIAFAILMAGCASTDETISDQNSITMQTQLTASTVSQTAPEKGAIPSAGVTSVVVTKVSVFVKDIKIHSVKDDSVKEDHDGTIKTGPMVMVFDSTGLKTVMTSTISAGDYDRVKFEIHKPNKGDAEDKAMLDQFPEFQNGDKGYTVVVQGYSIGIAGDTARFSVHSSATENITIKMRDKDDKEEVKVHFSGGGSSKLLFLFDPVTIFKATGLLIDPKTITDLDKQIVAAIKIQVK